MQVDSFGHSPCMCRTQFTKIHPIMCVCVRARCVNGEEDKVKKNDEMYFLYARQFCSPLSCSCQKFRAIEKRNSTIIRNDARRRKEKSQEKVEKVYWPRTWRTNCSQKYIITTILRTETLSAPHRKAEWSEGNEAKISIRCDSEGRTK